MIMYNQDAIIVKNNSIIFRFETQDILYIEKIKKTKNIQIVLKTRTITTACSLEKCLKLSQAYLQQLNKCILINRRNIDYISNIEIPSIRFLNGLELTISENDYRSLCHILMSDKILVEDV